MRSNLHRRGPSRSDELSTGNATHGVTTRLPSRKSDRWASAQPLSENHARPVGSLAAEPAAASSTRPQPLVVRPIRAAMKTLLEGVLVIAVFMTITVAILAVKYAIWMPYLHG